MAGTVKDSIKTRKVAFLVADGVNENAVMQIQETLMDEGAVVHIIAPRQGTVIAQGDTLVPVNHSLLTAASVLYDAVYVPGGTNSVATLAADPDAVHFLNEAYRHCKAIAADADAMPVVENTYFSKKVPLDEGVIVTDDLAALSTQFIAAIAMHRFWDREVSRRVPA